MLKNKLVVVAMAGMLAMCVGLTACGGGNASSSSAAASGSAAASSAATTSSAAASSAASTSSAAASSAATTSSAAASSAAASSAAASTTVAFWEGTLNDGSSVSFKDDPAIGMAGILVVKEDLSNGDLWVGTSRADGNNAFIVTDAETGRTIRYVVNESSDDLMRIELDGYGVVDLRPVTEAQYNAFVQKLEKAGEKLEKKYAKQAKKLMERFNALDDSTVLFWDGTLANGNYVSFMDDSSKGVAFLSVIKPDYSNGMVWYGNYNADAEGKVMTLRDEESGQTVAYQVLESTDDSMKMHIDWYGDVELKPVTKADFEKYVEEVSKYASQTSSSASASSASASSEAASSESASAAN